MTEVVAALIWWGKRFLACRRPAHKGNPLLWEFVGGKVKPGETAARRYMTDLEMYVHGIASYVAVGLLRGDRHEVLARIQRMSDTLIQKEVSLC